ncbi:hypothetical protein T439DRAFT_231216 [Meredithblackwellia eburnea MCA 4105]
MGAADTARNRAAQQHLKEIDDCKDALKTRITHEEAVKLSRDEANKSVKAAAALIPPPINRDPSPAPEALSAIQRRLGSLEMQADASRKKLEAGLSKMDEKLGVELLELVGEMVEQSVNNSYAHAEWVASGKPSVPPSGEEAGEEGELAHP